MVKQRAVFGSVALVAVLIAAAASLVVSGGLGASAAASVGARQAGTTGCGQAPALASGTHTIQSSGQTRSYILQVPDNYDPNHPYRLVFAFHWNGGTAGDVDSGGSSGYVWSYYGLRAQANNSTIFVAPQGINNGWADSNGQDVTFVDDMLNQFEAGLCVDTTEIFSMGFSYGAGMTYALACARPTVFRAVAVYSGANLSGCAGGTQPVAYIGLHGVEDNVLPIADGRGLRDTFVRNNGCTPQNPPEPAVGSLTHIVTTYSGCRAGYPVVWAAFDSGHTPAPVDGSNATSGTGAQTWTKALVWNFFSQFQSGQPPTTGPTTTPPTTTPPTTTPPTTTPPTTTPPTTTPPTTTPASGACSAAYQTVNSWPGGFQGQVTVTAGSSAINGWTVRWTLASGQTISQVWNGTLTTSGSSVSVGNVSYNGALQPGASTTFGFLANGAPSAPVLSCTSP